MPTSLTYILLLGQRLLTSETCCGYWYGYIGLARTRAIACARAHHTHFDFHGLFVRLQYAPQHRRRHSPCLDPSPTDLLPGRPTPSARPARARAPRPQPRRDAAALTAHTHTPSTRHWPAAPAPRETPRSHGFVGKSLLPTAQRSALSKFSCCRHSPSPPPTRPRSLGAARTAATTNIA